MPDPVAATLKFLAPLLFAAGVAWGTVQFTVGTLSAKIDRIDQRVAEMYCAQLPPNLRAGCR